MKNLILLILIIIVCSNINAATYYISPSGTDGIGHAGTIGDPWATLYYANSRVTSSGDIIHVNNGTYTITTQVRPSIGVSIEGEGATSIFNCSVAASDLWGNSGYAILLTSGSLSNGNQHISGIRMNGMSYTGWGAIGIWLRNNVTINNCSFINFGHWGVRFYGGEPPVTYMTGSSFHDNTVTDCAGFWSSGGVQGNHNASSSSLGGLGIGGLDGMTIYNNTITQPGVRGYANEGEPIFGVEGYIKNVKIYNNVLNKKLLTSGAWDFAIEIWNWLGGNEIYNNDITGSIDIVGATTKGSSTYSVWVHDNNISQPALSTKQSVRGILLEGLNTDVIIERNYIHTVCQGIYIQTSFWDGRSLLPQTNITIRYNIIDDIGSLYGSSGWGLYFSQEDGDDPVTNFNVYNNVFKASTTRTDSRWGIGIPDCSISSSNININNNIIQGFSYAPIRMNDWSSGNTTVTNLNIRSNILYGNGNSNNVSFATGTTVNSYTNNSNLTTAPPFVSSTNYHLTASRPGYYITSGLMDKDLVAVSNPPTIGAYEYGTTVLTLPVLTTTIITSIGITTASSGGVITSQGNSSVTARGVCWSASPSVDINDNITANGSGIGTFSSSITGLMANTVYYVAAYATNSAGTAYGNEISFSTLPIVGPTIPILSTTSVSSIALTTASSGGNITSNGGEIVTARGVCVSTSINPTVSANIITSDGSGNGIFTSNITGLSSGTTYHVRAYATNSVGTGYGTDRVFTTTSVLIPTITTTAVTSISSTSAVSGGVVTNDGGATITSRGACWSTSINPIKTYSHTTDGSGTGTFISNISGLTKNTIYHLRAWATNSAGTAYGNDVLFTTPSDLIVVDPSHKITVYGVYIVIY